MALESVLAKSCICRDLAGGATVKYGIDPDATPAVCCGPGIVSFSRAVTLQEMVVHIYGRSSLKSVANRPHMFIRELAIYAGFIRDQSKRVALGILDCKPTYLSDFRDKLLGSIEYYRSLAAEFTEPARTKFTDALRKWRRDIESVPV